MLVIGGLTHTAHIETWRSAFVILAFVAGQFLISQYQGDSESLVLVKQFIIQHRNPNKMGPFAIKPGAFLYACIML